MPNECVLWGEALVYSAWIQPTMKKTMKKDLWLAVSMSDVLKTSAKFDFSGGRNQDILDKVIAADGIGQICSVKRRKISESGARRNQDSLCLVVTVGDDRQHPS